MRVSMDGEHLRDKLDGTSIFVDSGLHTFRFESEAGAPTELRQMLRRP